MTAVLTVLGQIDCKKEPQAIKIGVILPLTGSAAEIAQQHKIGLDLAVEEINSRGGINGKKLQLIYENDQNEPKLTVSAFNKLVTVDRVPLIITVMSSPSMAIYNQAEQKGVVLFANCGHPEITSLSDWVFRNFPTSKHEALKMAEFAFNKMGIRKIAIFYINDAFGEAAMKMFSQHFHRLGGQILKAEAFEKDGTDFRASIRRLIAAKPEAIYIYGYGKANGIALKQTKELQYKGYILGSYNFSVEPTISLAKEALEGTYYTTPAFDASSVTDTLTLAIVKKFETRFGALPNWNSVIEFDALFNLLTPIFSKYGTVPQKIKTGLENFSDFQGVAGFYKYDPVGEWVIDLVVKKVEGTTGVQVYP